jgi:uncharacterized membrane protein (DUF485 family)
MRKSHSFIFLFCAITLAMTLIMPGLASAKSVWTGTQVMTPISGEFAFSQAIGVRAHLARFFVPKVSFAPSFIYIGPTFKCRIGHGVTLWVSPQATAWLN